MDFPVFEVRGYGFYIISNLEQDKLFEVRKISDIENFWGRVNMLAKVGLNASENLIELTENVGNSEARDVLMQIGYKTRQDIAKTYPQFDKFILDEICARYNIK